MVARRGLFAEPNMDDHGPRMSAFLGDGPRILVVGCGSVGGVLAARLHQEGHHPYVATTNEAVRSVWTKAGPILNGEPPLGPLPESHVLRSALDSAQPFDVVFVAVQPAQIEDVALTLKERLAPDGRVICLPNGLCEDRLAKTLGGERIIGAVVAWGARMPQPGMYTKTSEGGFRVGTLNGHHDPRLEEASQLLGTVGPVVRTHNLRGARFTKLALNCAVSTLGTIGGSTLGELLVRAEVRDLALDILSEAVRVARAEGIVLEPVTNLDLDWLVPVEADRGTMLRSVARHAMLLAVGARYRNLRSSMLAAIERGKAPSVDFLNGEIVSRGKQLGVPTPVNEAASRVVWDIANGKRAAGAMALRGVREVSDSMAC